jgi:signal transduction histidine kinase/ActR/RegA family two-component response regulator
MVGAGTLGRGAAWLFSGLSMVGLALVGWGEHAGVLPAAVSPSDSTLNTWIAMAATVALGTYILNATLDAADSALAKAMQHQAERDRAQAELVQAQKLEVVGRLASGVAHDFNNLLTVIMGAVGLLRRDGRPNPEVLDSVEDAARRASLLTTRLLAFGRPQAAAEGRVSSLSDNLTDLAPLLRRLVGDEVQVAVEVDAAVSAEIDPVAFEQVLINLVINAREAIAGSGTITVRLTAEDGDAVLQVQDTGAGVDPGVRERIFTPFFTTKETGTGLGLSTVSALVEGADGRIELLESEVGARFRVRIPAREAVGPSEAKVQPAESVLPKLQVLVVDDDPLVLEATAAGLQASGCEVSRARDGLEALSTLETRPVDVVVTDNAMHGMSGTELVARVRQVHPRLPMLLVSGNPVEDPLPPAVRFVSKPYDQSTLRNAIAELIDSATSDGARPATRP